LTPRIINSNNTLSNNIKQGVPLLTGTQRIEIINLRIPCLPKEKRKELTVDEVKKMIYKEIQKKQKRVDPEKFNIRIVEDNLAEVEAMQQIHAMIIDEELRRKRQTDQQMMLG
jgi:hypothetical protein